MHKAIIELLTKNLLMSSFVFAAWDTIRDPLHAWAALTIYWTVVFALMPGFIRDMRKVDALSDRIEAELDELRMRTAAIPVMDRAMRLRH